MVRQPSADSCERRLNQFVLLVALGAVPAAAIAVALIGDMHADLYPASGTVLVDGIAPEGAELELRPLEVDAWLPTNPTAVVAADGSFRVKTLGYRDGARPGRYAVTITWRKPQFDQEDAPLGSNLLPSRFAKAASTPWRVEILPQANKLSALALSCNCSEYLASQPYGRDRAANGKKLMLPLSGGLSKTCPIANTQHH